MTTRVLDWRTRLMRWGRGQVGHVFSWGETDCATLVRQALVECFGRDVFPTLPQWRTARQAVVVLRRYGPPPKILLAAGAQQMSLNFVRSGDVLYIPEPQEEIGRAALGVWIDDRCLTSSEAGVQLLPRVAIHPETEVYSLVEVADCG